MKFVYFCRNIETGEHSIFTSEANFPEGIIINGVDGKCIIEDSYVESEDKLFYPPRKTVLNLYEKARGASL